MSAATTLTPGFYPDPGTDSTTGNESQIASRLDSLAKSLGVVIYGISGYRTPAHSVAVGGFANDPHTKGDAEDIGVGGQLRSSAAQITNSELAAFGLVRPFDTSDDPNNTEVNHIQLLDPNGSSTAATSTPAPAPASSSGSGVLGTGIGPNVGPDLNPVDAVSGLFSNFLSWLESNLLRGALFGVLVIGGVSLAVFGLTHAVGRHQPAEA